jgi:signal peptidase I
MRSKKQVKTKDNKFSLKKSLSLKSVMIFFGLVWLITILIFLFFIVVGTDFFQTTVDKGPLQSDVWVIVLIIDILAGIGAFLVFAMLLTVMAMKKKDHIKQKTSLPRKLINFILFFIYLAVLPIYLLVKIWKPKKLISFVKNIKKNLKKKTFISFVKKLVASLPVLLILLPVWAVGYFSVGTLTAEQLGLITQSTSISGTGSMYPTFPKGEGKDPLELSNQIVSTQGMFPYPNGLVLFGNRYFGHEIQRGDIVIVEDDKTRKITEEMYGDPSGWVKRVVAISGDKLEIKDGIVYLNDEPQKEPYVARARSTFGESFLQECQQVTVPENSVFVMGDNRTGSGDSREVGFFSIDDINHALPWKDQEKDLSQNWHDTTNDLEESARIKLNKQEYLEALNKKREEDGLKPLKYNEKLEQSAQKRGEIILEYNDFSFEATASGYSMEKTVREVGYYNTFWGEAPSIGYYEAQELLDNQLEFPESKSFIFDKRFQEIGIAEVLGEINGCPAHVIVQHFGGYIPPNYSASDIQSWEDSLNSLRNIQSGWNGLKNSGDYYNRNKDKIDRINQIIDIRINKINDIVGTMKANKWFSSAQRAYAESGDMNLYREQEELANFLNGQ